MAHTTLTDFRAHLASYCDRVTADREALLVTRPGGKGNLVLMAEDEFAGWQETVHLLSSPKNAARLMRSIQRLRAGKVHEHALVVPEKV